MRISSLKSLSIFKKSYPLNIKQNANRISFENSRGFFLSEEEECFYDSEYKKYLLLLNDSSAEVRTKFHKLYCSKDFTRKLSAKEAFIFAHEHGLEKIFKYLNSNYDYSTFDKVHENELSEYIASLKFDKNDNKYKISQKDIESYIEYTQELPYENSKIPYGLKYIALINGYKPLKTNFNKSAAAYLIENNYELKEIYEYDNYISNNPKVKELLDKWADIESEINISKIQESNDYEILITKISKKEEGAEFTETYKIKPDGTCTESTSIQKGGLTISKNKQSNVASYTYETKNKRDNWIIDENLDVFYDKNSNSSKVLHTKAYEDLYGSHIIDLYYLEGQIDKETIDAIRRKEYTPNDKIAEIKRWEDGSIEYIQNYHYNGTESKIIYWQNKDRSETIYSYTIIDENGDELIHHSKTFEKIDNNTTLTTINGKKYICKYEKDRILILTDKGTEEFDINKHFVDINTCKKNRKFIKKIPADILLSIKEKDCVINFINEDDNSFIFVETKKVFSSKNITMLTHELGHAIDFIRSKDQNEKYNFISQDEKLKEIYSEELEKYEKIFSQKIQELTIQYFSKTGGSNFGNTQYVNTGLSEIVAETNSLLSSFGTTCDETKYRTHILVKYFPRTIAKCAELLSKEIKI